MKKKVIVIGAGVAGIEASSKLASMGFDVTLIEKGKTPGGKLLQWDRLFPSQQPAAEILEFLQKNLDKHNLRTKFDTVVKDIKKENGSFTVFLDDKSEHQAEALLIATGYDLFNARIKEEYGYGIYNNVITSAELESLFLNKMEILTAQGQPPKRVAFIHCVGSRDEKVGNTYCSQVCCVTAVKQAIEMREKLPRTEVFCFYMDIRMFGLHFEELYKESQEKWDVNFIRGRLSEASENLDGSILIKVEDTLAGRPLKMRVDLLVLMVGFVPSAGTKEIQRMLGIGSSAEGFIKPKDEFTMNNESDIPGVFIAGTCKAPKTIPDTFADARAATLKIAEFLNKNSD